MVALREIPALSGLEGFVLLKVDEPVELLDADKPVEK
jgi:hypothetical protein